MNQKTVLNLKKNPDCLLILSLTILATLIGSASILATSLDAPHGCSLSPNNKGCKLNRPVDAEREAKKHKFIPQNGYRSLNFYKYQ